MTNFEITVAGLPDRDELVAEIFHENLQFVEISYENEKLMIEFYGYEERDIWQFSYYEIMDVIEKAKQRLFDVLGLDDNTVK